MITIEIYCFITTLVIVLLTLSYFMNKNKQSGLLIRISSAVMLLTLGLTMIISQVTYTTGSTINQINTTATTINYTQAPFTNAPIAITIIIISLAIIIFTSINLYDSRFEEDKETEGVGILTKF